MAEFPRRSIRPMQPSSYRVAANKIRKMADQLEARAEAETSQEKRARTLVIHRLSQYTQHLSRRNRK